MIDTTSNGMLAGCAVMFAGLMIVLAYLSECVIKLKKRADRLDRDLADFKKKAVSQEELNNLRGQTSKSIGGILDMLTETLTHRQRK